jgi:hypothetical protein
VAAPASQGVASLWANIMTHAFRKIRVRDTERPVQPIAKSGVSTHLSVTCNASQDAKGGRCATNHTPSDIDQRKDRMPRANRNVVAGACSGRRSRFKVNGSAHSAKALLTNSLKGFHHRPPPVVRFGMRAGAALQPTHLGETRVSRGGAYCIRMMHAHAHSTRGRHL